MNKTYQIKTNAIEGASKVIDVAPAMGKAPVTVPAATGARYELIDPKTKAAPDNIRVMRKGNNLQIFFDGDTEPGAVIENFYQAHTDGQPTLVGSTEQGTLYEYIPESAAPSAVVAHLGDTGYAYGMALGGQELAASGAAVGLLAPVAGIFSPWLLGAGALGAAALAGGGGGSSGSGTGGGGGGTVKPNDGKAVGLTIDMDKDNNGYISKTEKGDATTTSVTATFDSSKVAAGQVLNFTDGTKTQAYTLTAADVTAGKVTINSWPVPAQGGSLTVKATLTDGTNTTQDASDTVTIDTTAPNDGKVVGLKVDLDTNADGTINGTEKGTAQTTSLTATFDKTKVSVGDKITFSDGSNIKVVVLTADHVAAGQVSSADWPLPAEDASLTYTAILTDLAGNPTPEARQSLKMDAVTESLKTALSIHPVATDNLISLAEQTAATVTVTGKVSGTFAEGDLVSLFINKQTFTGKADANGNYSISIPVKDLQADSDAMLEGSVSGSNGGQLATASQNYVIETSSNSGKITSLSINPITSDNLLSIEETKPDSINITGKVTGQFTAGDAVSLLVNGVISKGTVNANGTFSVAVKTQDLLKDGDTTVDATITGASGTPVKAMQNYGVDATAPKILSLNIDMDNANKDGLITNGDGWINKSEKNSLTTTSLTAFFDSSTVSVGDVITFSDGTTTRTVTLDDSAIKAGKATSTDWTLPTENSTLKVTAFIKDAAGNISPVTEDYATVDTVVTSFSGTDRKESGGDSGKGTPSDLTSTTFQLSTGSVLETGTYKLHLGSTVIEKSSVDGHLALTNSASIPKIAAKDIYLEFWDAAGNHSTTYLKSDTDASLYNIAANAQFIV